MTPVTGSLRCASTALTELCNCTAVSHWWIHSSLLLDVVFHSKYQRLPSLSLRTRSGCKEAELLSIDLVVIDEFLLTEDDLRVVSAETRPDCLVKTPQKPLCEGTLLLSEE